MRGLWLCAAAAALAPQEEPAAIEPTRIRMPEGRVATKEASNCSAIAAGTFSELQDTVNIIIVTMIMSRMLRWRGRRTS